MKWYADQSSSSEDRGSIYQALAVTLIGNLLLAVMKLLAARASGSSALLADAYNSISDVMYSVTLVFGLMLALRPADPSHPQGHGRFEPLVGLIISFSMAWAGYEALHGSVEKIQHGFAPASLGMPTLVLLLSALIKGVMYWLVNRVAVRISNPTLKTAAEDNLMDTITSATAIVGILLSAWIDPLADPIAGILVSVWIFRAAFNALRENLGFLTGAGASQSELEELRRQIAAVPGVLNVHQLFAEYVGTKLLLDVHINVAGSKTLNEVHSIETEIESLIKENKDVERIYIHAEPPEYQ